MSDAAIEARHLTLVRFEHAAGAAFGYEDDAAAAASRMLTPSTFALATLAAAAAATLVYLV